MSAYPEHDKLVTVSDKSQVVGDFIEWLKEQDVHLMKWAGEWVFDGRPIHKLLAAFFDIDLEKLDDEKRAMVATLRGGS